MNIPKLFWGFRILDFAMFPVMWVLNRCRLEKPQETHMWHCVPWKQNLDLASCVSISGEIKHKSRFSPFFHMPLLGTGWESYIVLQPVNYRGDWYIGWKASDSGREKELNILKLKQGEPVKLLVSDSEVYFFGLDSEGRQIKLEKMGEGHLGDKKFSFLRQF